MGARATTSYTVNILNNFPVGTAETIILTSAQIVLPADNAQVLLAWFLSIAFGSTDTLVTAGLRRGTDLTGPLVGAAHWNVSVGPALYYTLSGWYIDNPGVSQPVYTLTGSHNVSSGGSGVIDGCLWVFAL